MLGLIRSEILYGYLHQLRICFQIKTTINICSKINLTFQLNYTEQPNNLSLKPRSKDERSLSKLNKAIGSEFMYVSIYSTLYNEINLYLCFGSQQPNILQTNGLSKYLKLNTKNPTSIETNPLDTTSPFNLNARYGSRNVSKLKNVKLFTEYYEKLGRLEEEEDMRRELFSSINSIKTKRKEQIISRHNSQCDITSKDLNDKISTAKKRRVSIEKIKRKKCILFLKNNLILKERTKKLFEERIRDRAEKKRIKSLHGLMLINNVFAKLNTNFKNRQVQRDKIQKIYRFCFCIKAIINRYFRRFGRELNTRLHTKLRHAMTFGNNAKFINYESKSKMILSKFMQDRLYVIRMQELFIEFGKEVYDYNQELNGRLIPGGNYSSGN